MLTKLTIGLATLVISSASWTIAIAQDSTLRYRVAFKHGAAERFESGDLGLRNTEALAAIAGILSSWPTGTSARFLYVSSGVASCQGLPNCNADRLLSQRSAAVTFAVRGLLRQRNLPPPPNPGEANLESLGTGASLPASQHDTSPIDLHLFVSEQRDGSANCPWAIGVQDASLPPILSPRGGLDVLPVANGGTAPLSPTAEIIVRTTNRSAIGGFASVWELEGGTMCRTEPMPSGQLAIPGGDVQRLYLVLGTGSSAREKELLATVPCTRNRDTRSMASVFRGVGEGARVIPQGTVQPAPSANVCIVSIVQLPRF